MEMAKPIDQNQPLNFASEENQLTSNLPIRVIRRDRSKFWQRLLIVQGIAWLGGIGIVGSSIGWTQEQPATIPDALPKASPVEPGEITPRRAPARLGRRLRSQLQSQRNSSIATNNNTYIDSTDYSLGATRRSRIGTRRDNDGPSTVVLTERSTGCQRVVSGGEFLGRRCGSGSVARVRTRVRESVGSGDRIATSPSRSTRIGRFPIARNPQPAQNDRLARRFPIARTRRPAQIQIDTIASSAPNNRLAQPTAIRGMRRPAQIQIETIASNRQSDRIENPAVINNFRRRSQTAWQSRSRGVAVAGVGPVNIGSVNDNSSNIPARHWNSINSQNAIATAKTNQGIPPWPGVDYNAPANPSTTYKSSRTLPIVFPLPLPAQITSVFGWRIHPINGDVRFHSGTDLGAAMGTPVLAAYAGRVALADFLGGYGLTVVLQHNDGTQETRYAHLSEAFVHPGDFVEQGTVIGRVGNTGNSTGPHLHFEIREQTPEGWIALDPGAQLEYSLAQLVNALQIAQSPQPNNSQLPKATQPQIEPDNAELPEIIIPQTPPFMVLPPSGG